MKPIIGCAKERSEAHKRLISRSYRMIDNTAMGKLYASLDGDMLRRSVVDNFGRIRNYAPKKATIIDKQLYL